MQDETPEDRLEAALERIAALVETQTDDPQTGMVAERLDRIIATVRDALGDTLHAKLDATLRDAPGN